MSATVKIINHMEVTIGGELKEMGSRTVAQEITIDGEIFEIITKITNAADPNDFVRVLLWQDGDGGIDEFDVLALETDTDLLLELTIDRAGTPKYATIAVEADVPLILSSDDLLTSITVDGTVTTMDQIDQIAVQNNNNDISTATVRLVLLT